MIGNALCVALGIIQGNILLDFYHFHKKGRRDEMHFPVTAPLVKKRLERSAELVGATPLVCISEVILLG